MLAALKAALPSADEADKPAIQTQIDIYESALADEAYRTDFDPSRDPTAVELIIGRVSGFLTPMSAGTLRSHIMKNDVCTHNGTVYRALSDVAVGQEPDDVFDADAGTGGWMPADFNPQQRINNGYNTYTPSSRQSKAW